MKEKGELNEQTKGIEGFSHDYKTNQFLIKAQFALCHAPGLVAYERVERIFM